MRSSAKYRRSQNFLRFARRLLCSSAKMTRRPRTEAALRPSGASAPHQFSDYGMFPDRPHPRAPARAANARCPRNARKIPHLPHPFKRESERIKVRCGRAPSLPAVSSKPPYQARFQSLTTIPSPAGLTRKGTKAAFGGHENAPRLPWFENPTRLSCPEGFS